MAPSVHPRDNGRSAEDIKRFLQDYYGKRLQKTSDLQAGACCTDETQRRFGSILAKLPDPVVSRQYGCGSPLPDDDLRGLKVVDLGCGSGTDVFIAASLVGAAGQVIGVDMTEEQLHIARSCSGQAMEALDLPASMVEFQLGHIEELGGLADNSVDLVISNCVINLSPRKGLVFENIRRVLKPGGELYISDITCDRRLPDALRGNLDLYSECLTGAEYEADLYDLMETHGFLDVRVVNRTLLEDQLVGNAARFYSVTLRGFNIELDRRCEDYGQFATYKGTIPGAPTLWGLDAAHTFEADRPMSVCRNTARMLKLSRLGKHFEVSPEKAHFGLFDCGPSPATHSSDGSSAAACC